MKQICRKILAKVLINLPVKHKQVKTQVKTIQGILLLLALISSQFIYVNTSSAQKRSENYTSAKNANINAEKTINNAIVVLMGLLPNKNPEARINAARALGGLGTYGKIATPALIAALKDQDHRVRYSAAIALTNLGEHTQATLPLVIEALQDESKLISADAVSAIANSGYTLQKKFSKLSTPELKQILSYFNQALLHLQNITNTSSSNSISAIRTHRNLLEAEIKRR